MGVINFVVLLGAGLVWIIERYGAGRPVNVCMGSGKAFYLLEYHELNSSGICYLALSGQ